MKQREHFSETSLLDRAFKSSEGSGKAVEKFLDTAEVLYKKVQITTALEGLEKKTEEDELLEKMSKDVKVIAVTLATALKEFFDNNSDKNEFEISLGTTLGSVNSFESEFSQDLAIATENDRGEYQRNLALILKYLQKHFGGAQLSSQNNQEVSIKVQRKKSI